MKNPLFILLLFISAVTNAQTSEMTLTVKEIGIDNSEGSNSPYINYVNDKGEEMWFAFTLPEIGMEEWAEIKIGEELLIKIGSIYRYGTNPGDKMIESFILDDNVAKKLVGKKIKLAYTPIDLTNYLYSIELIN